MANFTAEERETSPSAGANPSAIGWKADIQCPLFESYPFLGVRMSAFGGKADSLAEPSERLLIAKRRH